MNLPAPPAEAAASSDLALGRLVEELTARLQAGERVTAEACVREHPEHAAALQRLLPALQMLAGLARSGAGDSASGVRPSLPPEEVAGAVGDFRIVREVGRGGMGVVYEAEQISLGRRVALKVLPFAAALDARQLQRFRNEAQAAAQLHHTHIVPVHFVGCERGVHFYAMQFIEGQTLASMVRELRQLTGREATDSNHSSGVPSGLTQRLTYGHEASAHLWSMESQAAPSPPPLAPAAGARGGGEGAAPATPPAAALSTERSMRSPAYFQAVVRLGVQAAEALEHAHQVGVIHRDVKPANLLVDARGHLWVTDFGLAHVQSNTPLTLTGDLVGTLRYMSPEQAMAQRGALDHRTDIYSLGATLYELLTLEPAFPGEERHELLRQIAFEEPRAPRRVNRAVPAELEIIVLKALAKDPAERYATARELADDLGRFLKDEPIRARRPAFAQRVKKWGRRHRPLVTAAGLFLLLAVGGLAATTPVVWRAERRATAEWAKAQAAYEAEVRQRERAEANVDLAWHAADRMHTHVVEDWLENQPGLEQIQEQFLLDVLAFYERFARENGTDPRVRRETGRAFYRAGRIHDKLGAPEKAEEAYRRATDLQQALADEFPGEPGHRHELAMSLLGWGTVLLSLERVPEAERPVRRALLLLQQLGEESPLSPQYRETTARVNRALALIGQKSGRPEEVAEQLERSLALYQKLRDEVPANPHYRRSVAVALHNRGLHRQQLGRLRDAKDDLRQSQEIKRQLADEFPAVVAFRMDLANGAVTLGALLHEAGQLPEAEKVFRETEPLLQRLAAEFPRVHLFQHRLARSHHHLGRLLEETGQLPEAERQHAQSVAVLQKLADAVPLVPLYRNDLAVGHVDLAHVRRVTGRPAEAEPALRQALALFGKLVDEHPKTASYRKDLANAYNSLGGVLGEQGRPDEALPAFRAALQLKRGLVEESPDRAQYRDSLARTLHNLAHLLTEKGDAAEGVSLLHEAVVHGTAAVASRPEHPPYRELLVQLHQSLAELQLSLGRHAEASRAAAVPRVDAERWSAAHWAAAVLSRCARLAAKDESLSEGQRLALAGDYADQARLWLQEAARRAADDPAAMNDLAWRMASDPDPALRDARRAVALAQPAVERRPEVGPFWTTLGVAHYRAGEWRAAVAALEKARTMQTGHERAVAGFALAMACWKAGDRERARACYDQAAREAEALSPSRALQDFRTEAAALLGLPASPLPKANPADPGREGDS